MVNKVKAAKILTGRFWQKGFKVLIAYNFIGLRLIFLYKITINQ